MTRVRNVVWPDMGWRRTVRFFRLKVERLPESPDAVAAGFGWGFAISMTPLLGLHMILSAVFSRATKASVVAALIATFAVNPWTAPPVWIATYYAGKAMTGDLGDGRLPGFFAMFRGLSEAVFNLDGHLFVKAVWPVFGPMLIGSLPVGAVAGIAVYAVIRRALTKVHAHQAETSPWRHRSAH